MPRSWFQQASGARLAPDGMPSRRRTLARVTTSALVAALMLTALGLRAPQAVEAAGGLNHSAAVTFTVNPDAARLDVSIALQVKNVKPNSGGYTYYFAGTTVILERGATNVRVSASSGTASIALDERVNDYYDAWMIRFSNLNYGQSRRLTVTYQLPGGAPRSGAATRIGKAYASFCVIGNGDDSGTVQVVTPSTFTWDVSSHEGVLVPATAGGTTTYTSNNLADPYSFWACFSGSDMAGFATRTFTSPGGRRIDVQAWPEDPAWLEQVGGLVAAAVPELEKVVGRTLPGSVPIVIREVTSSSLGNYAGSFDAGKMLAFVSEQVDPTVVSHEIAHAWFNGTLFDARWLSEGSAGWAEGAVTGDACTSDPGAAPSTSAKLSQWTLAGPKATEADLRAVTYQYAAACFVMTTLANRVGPDRMRAVLTALLDRKVPYQGGPTALAGAAGTQDWRDWLDAIDELGLVPAGDTDFDYAQNLLVRFGAATDTSKLGARSSARIKYHDLVRLMSGWTMPEYIVRAMADWNFSGATDAIDSAEAIWKTVNETATILPEAHALTGPVKTAFEGARFTGDLKPVKDMADTQKAAADLIVAAKARVAAPRPDVVKLGLTGKDVAATLAEAVAAVAAADLETTRARIAEIDKVLADETVAAEAMVRAKDKVDAPRDILTAIGLIGTDLNPSVATGVAAVIAIDPDAAKATAATIEGTLADAAQQGLIRLAVAIGVLLLVALITFLLLRRRRRGARLAAAQAGVLTTTAGLATTTAAADLAPLNTGAPGAGPADVPADFGPVDPDPAGSGPEPTTGP